MPKNRGNTGHKGYKMAKVVDLVARDGYVFQMLQCGHAIARTPFEVKYEGVSAEEYAANPENREHWIGSRQRCENKHE